MIAAVWILYSCVCSELWRVREILGDWIGARWNHRCWSGSHFFLAKDRWRRTFHHVRLCMTISVTYPLNTLCLCSPSLTTGMVSWAW